MTFLYRMPGGGPKFFPCVLCNKRTKPRERRKITTQETHFLQKTFLITVKDTNDTLCNRCRHKYYAAERQKIQVVAKNDESNDEYIPTPKRPKSSALSSPPSISLSIPSTPKSHAQCFLCKRPGPKLVVVPSNARFDVFMNCEIIVPAGSRCCPNHLENSEFKANMLHRIKTPNSSLLAGLLLLNWSKVYE